MRKRGHAQKTMGKSLPEELPQGMERGHRGLKGSGGSGKGGTSNESSPKQKKLFFSPITIVAGTFWYKATTESEQSFTTGEPFEGFLLAKVRSSLNKIAKHSKLWTDHLLAKRDLYLNIKKRSEFSAMLHSHRRNA